MNLKQAIEKWIKDRKTLSGLAIIASTMLTVILLVIIGRSGNMDPFGAYIAPVPGDVLALVIMAADTRLNDDTEAARTGHRSVILTLFALHIATMIGGLIIAF